MFMEKICRMCKVLKPLNEFSKHKNGKYGVEGRCKECCNLYKRKKYRKDKEYRERAMRRGRKNRYNLNDNELDLLLIKTSCDICGKEFKSSKDKHIDHNHNTGKIRGVLCSRCNTFLGYYELYFDLIKIFKHYLEC